ncbi:MAG: hypothetical protein PHI40_07290, partial [Caldisericia bacterium]|nr:hypothetical protein [Caldisericia bacterium]
MKTIISTKTKMNTTKIHFTTEVIIVSTLHFSDLIYPLNRRLVGTYCLIIKSYLSSEKRQIVNKQVNS